MPPANSEKILTDGTCFVQGTTLTCNRVPEHIPNAVRQVILKNIDIAEDALIFDGGGWEHITTLIIESDKGGHFGHGKNQSVFEALLNLRHLAIHGKKLEYVDKETLLGLRNLESLDLSYSNRLEANHAKKLFVNNSSLINLKVLSLGFLDRTPVTLDQEFLRNLGERPIESLGLQGLSIIKVALQSMQGLCNSLKTLNLSGSVYFPNTDIDGKGILTLPQTYNAGH